MHTKTSIKQAIKMYVADKPMLSRQFEKLEIEDDDMYIYAAFTGSVHEIPTRLRRKQKV